MRPNRAQRGDASDRSGPLFDADLILRPVVRDDAADILDAVRASLDHLRPWMQWAMGDVDHHDVDHFIDQVESGHEHSFAIRDRAGGAFLGACALNRMDRHHRTANLGFWLRSDATGRGVATRAARMVLVHGLTAMGLERIEVVASLANGPSLRVARRLGLVTEGVRRNALRIGDERHDARAFVAFVDDLPRLLAAPLDGSVSGALCGATHQQGVDMPESVYKVIELVGTSTESWEKAATAAVQRAGASLRDLRVAEVTKLDMALENGQVAAYRAKVNVSFKYEGE